MPQTCCCEFIKKLFFMPLSAFALIASGVFALASAMVLERFFDVLPCILCYYERVPYGLVILFGALALIFRKNERALFWLFILSALAFFAGAGIAFFHSGVELHWWAGTDDCEVNPLVLAGANPDPAALREALLSSAPVRCDEIGFTFLGFTLANWNVPICLGLGFYALIAAFATRIRLLAPAVGECCCCRKK